MTLQYASGALVKCRKVGAANWGNKSKKEGVNEGPQKDRNELALYMIELNKMLANAKILQKRKDPKAKIYIKMIQQDLKDAKKKLSKIKNESVNENKCLCEACWKGYEKKGMKKMFGKMYPNCVKKEGIKTTAWIGENEIYWENNIGESCGYTFEAEYQGRKVKLGKPTQGDAKKFKVYVKNDKGNVVKVNFGQGGDAKGGTMRIRKDNPKARKSFRARHNCDNPGPRYWVS